jgi:putative hydrolase of the HAD superfamily
MIRAVFFDAGATLLFPDPPVEKVYAGVFAAEGCALSADSLSNALERAWKAVRDENLGDRYGGVSGEAGFWKSFLNRVRSHLDGGAVSDEALDRLTVHFRNPASWRIFDDVFPALDALAQRGLAMAVVSNWDSYLPTLLEGLGLAGRFRTISVSAIEQTGKPDPEIFLRTCRRLGMLPAEVLHVGDSLVEDYEASRAAGLSALLLDRTGRYPQVEARVRTLSEVVPRAAPESLTR